MRTMNHHRLLIADDDEDNRNIPEHALREIHGHAPIPFFDSGDNLFRYLNDLEDPNTYSSLDLPDFSMPSIGAADIPMRPKATGWYSSIKAGVHSTAMDEALCRRLKTPGAYTCYRKAPDMNGSLHQASGHLKK